MRQLKHCTAPQLITIQLVLRIAPDDLDRDQKMRQLKHRSLRGRPQQAGLQRQVLRTCAW